MKRIISVVLILLLLTAALSLGAWAAGSSASLVGPATVRAGDTITLTFKVSGVNVFGASGTLQYDPDQLQLVGSKPLVSSPWLVEFNDNNFLAYDNNLDTPINSARDLFSVSFKVRSVDAGTQITVSYKDVKTSDGTADTDLGTVSYSVTVAPPLSTNNKLSQLTVSNATISPAFSPDITSYTAKVPFEVSKLEINAKAEDGKASVAVSSPSLVPNGTTNVTITVTAESGVKRTYTIAVSREQDPNYVASGNNDLSGIQVEGFLLSPVFDPATTGYLIWLPYEVDSVTVTGTAADSKASVRVEGGQGLLAGQDNVVKVICTAENGQEKVYTVIAKRAAAHDGSVDIPTVPPTEPPTEPPTQPPTTQPAPTTAPSTAPSTTQPPVAGPEEPASGVEAWVVVLVSVLSLLGGGAAGYLLSDKIGRIVRKMKK